MRIAECGPLVVVGICSWLLVIGAVQAGLVGATYRYEVVNPDGVPVDESSRPAGDRTRYSELSPEAQQRFREALEPPVHSVVITGPSGRASGLFYPSDHTADLFVRYQGKVYHFRYDRIFPPRRIISTIATIAFGVVGSATLLGGIGRCIKRRLAEL